VWLDGSSLRNHEEEALVERLGGDRPHISVTEFTAHTCSSMVARSPACNGRTPWSSELVSPFRQGSRHSTDPTSGMLREKTREIAGGGSGREGDACGSAATASGAVDAHRDLAEPAARASAADVQH